MSYGFRAQRTRYNRRWHMQNEMTQEQLEKIRPLVDRFLSPFHQLELAIPLETESAVIYLLEPGDRP